jgi:tRNA(fMet)-specific endonuclease VapC
MRYCLDTSAYSHFKRGDPQVVDLIDRAEWIGVPVIVLGELAVGFGSGTRSHKNEAELRQFLSNPAVDVLDVTADVVPIYADIVLALKKAGTPLPANDLWIAALAVRHGAPVLTYDSHFQKVARTGALVLSTPAPGPI